MSNERYKFRVWDTETECMTEPFNLVDVMTTDDWQFNCTDGQYFRKNDIIGTWSEFIFMQYTGWQTKPNPNQVDIYDGDLFCVEDVGICEVEFKHGSWYLGDELLYEFEESDGLIGWGVKLMGNKYQHPELLK